MLSDLGAPKVLRQLAGEPLLVHAVRRLRECPSVGPVVIAATPAELAVVRALLTAYDVLVVAGGGTRQDSVAAGLASLPAAVEFVLVHDAARALVPVAVVEAVVRALRAGAEAVIPVLPVPDTVKQVDAHDRVVATLDRRVLRLVQTPQGFRRDVLMAAHAAAPTSGDLPATDDAGLVERLGRPVLTVPGAEEAFKVTRPLDLLLAELVLAGG